MLYFFRQRTLALGCFTSACDEGLLFIWSLQLSVAKLQFFLQICKKVNRLSFLRIVRFVHIALAGRGYLASCPVTV